MISWAQYDIRQQAISEAKAILKTKAAGENPEDVFTFGKIYFCGNKKNSEGILFNPDELLNLYRNGFINIDSAALGYALYYYFYDRLSWNECDMLIPYGMVFEAGRLQGIREERRKHKGNTKK